LFLLKGLAGEFGDLLETQVLRERAGDSVAGDFVMPDALRRTDQSGVAHIDRGILTDKIRALFDRSRRRSALVAGELLPELLRDLVAPLDVTVWFVKDARRTVP